VGYTVHGQEFYHIPHLPLPRAKKDSKMAVISVVGASGVFEQGAGDLVAEKICSGEVELDSEGAW